MPGGRVNLIAPATKKLSRKTRRKIFKNLKYARKWSSNKATGGLMSEYLHRNPMPPSRKCAFTYTEDFLLYSQTTTGATGSEAVYHLNGLYQPQHTAGGTSHQPYGWDQMAAFYRRYKPYAVAWDIEFSNPTADGMYCVVMVQPSGSTGITGPGLTDSILREQPMTTVRYVNNSGEQKVRVKGFSPLHLIEGISKLQYNASVGDNYSRVVTANPQLTQYLRVSAGDTTTTGGLAVHCTVKLTYYVRMYDRKVLGQS